MYRPFSYAVSTENIGHPIQVTFQVTHKINYAQMYAYRVATVYIKIAQDQTHLGLESRRDHHAQLWKLTQKVDSHFHS